MMMLGNNSNQLIKFLNPKKIIVLGDNAYVPKKYLKMICLKWNGCFIYSWVHAMTANQW